MLTHLLDLLYPPKCGLCGKLGPRGLCQSCQLKFPTNPTPPPLLHPLTKIHAPYLYQDQTADAVKRLKFDRITPLAEPLSQLLWRVAEQIPCDAIVPVPIAKARRAERGFNQSELLCLAFPKPLVRTELLIRTRYTIPQANLDGQQRRSNLLGAFQAPIPLNGQKILLVDDVTTSGSTAIACAEALLAAGAGEVSLLALTYQPLS